MNPFDLPPATPPVSLDPPPPGGSPRRRGRTALVALAAAGLVGGGLVGVSQLVSADRPSVDDSALAAVDPPTDDDAGEEVPSEESAPDDGDGRDVPSVDGEIIIDSGDGEPIVVDLGEAGAAFEEFRECVGLPALPELGDPGALFDFEFDGELPFEEWDESKLDELLGDVPLLADGMFELDGTLVTVAGPDGVSVIDLGDGDGSVTITKTGDDVTITTDGGATVEELPGLGELAPLGEDFDPDATLDELFGEDFDPEAVLDELFGEDFDPEAVFEEFLGEFGELEDLGGPGVIEGGPLFEPGQLDECLEILHDG